MSDPTGRKRPTKQLEEGKPYGRSSDDGTVLKVFNAPPPS
jgi:hypothetical protein